MTAGDVVVIREQHKNTRKACMFDGTDDYVLADAHTVAAQVRADTVGTYTAWIYLNDLAGTYTILSAGDNNNANEFLHLTVKAGKLNVFLKDGGATRYDVIETTAILTARTWHHVAVVQTLTRPVLYVDGVAVAMTDTTSTALDEWYDVLQLCDKFAIGCLESNNTHTQDFNGAIGQVKYWSIALTANQVLLEAQGATQVAEAAAMAAALYFNITMEEGVTDSGLDAADGTLTGHAYWAGQVSDWSYAVERFASVSGHAGEVMTTFIDGDKYVSVIVMGD